VRSSLLTALINCFLNDEEVSFLFATQNEEVLSLRSNSVFENTDLHV